MLGTIAENILPPPGGAICKGCDSATLRRTLCKCFLRTSKTMTVKHRGTLRCANYVRSLFFFRCTIFVRSRANHTCPNKIFSGLIQPIFSRMECEIHHLPPRNARSLCKSYMGGLCLPSSYLVPRKSYIGRIRLPPPLAAAQRARTLQS